MVRRQFYFNFATAASVAPQDVGRLIQRAVAFESWLSLASSFSIAHSRSAGSQFRPSLILASTRERGMRNTVMPRLHPGIAGGQHAVPCQASLDQFADR